MKKIGISAACVCLLFLFSSFGVAASEADKEKEDASIGERPEFVPGVILIKFKDDASSDHVKDVKESLKAKEVADLKELGAKKWKLKDGADVKEALADLEKHKYKDDIDYAEPDYYMYADGPILSDANRGELWGMHNVGQTGGTADADIDALEAWADGKTGSTSVVVGIIDSGIDYNHDDLADNMWKNPGEYGKNAGVDDDGNGYIDDIYGWDFYNNDNDPMDDNGHGTHTAGTVGAVGNNGMGVMGVCWSVKLMALKFLNSGGSGPTTAAISAINYAASFKDQNGNNIVRITSNSWGGGQRSSALETAIKNSGALFVASAGNSGSSSKQYPAGYAADNIISVAATDSNDALASFSNYGSTWVDLGAPGVSVASTLPSNKYGLKSGTSMAAPHVSGAAALLMSHTSKTNGEVKTQILNTVDALSSLSGKCVSGGRLNVKAALEVSTGLPPDGTAPDKVTSLTAGTPTEDSLPFTWTPTYDDGSTSTSGAAYMYDIRYVMSTTFDESAWDTATQPIGEPGPTVSATDGYTLTGLQSGTDYAIRIKVMDEMGNWGPLSDSATGKTVSLGYSYTVDGTIDPGTDTFYHSLAVDSSGNPAIAYGNEGTDNLWYAKWNPSTSKWDVQTVDTAGSTDLSISLVLEDSGNPTMTYGYGKLQFARWDPSTSSWVKETVEARKVTSDYSSLAYDGSGNPSVSYGHNSGLKFAKKSNGVWSSTVVDSGAAARYNCLAYNPKTGYPAIAYCDDANGDNGIDTANYAYYDGSGWNVETIESLKPFAGVHIGLDFSSDGTPYVVYCYNKDNLKEMILATRTGANSWNKEVVCTQKYFWGFCIQLTSTDAPYIAVSYTSDGSSIYTLRVAYETEDGWVFEKVSNNCYNHPRLVLYNDNPCLSFVDRTEKFILYTSRG